MEHIYQYSWIIPFVTFPAPMLIGAGLLLFPAATKKLRRMWAFPSLFLLSIVMIFSIDLSIHQINSSFIYQYIWSWTINNDFSLEFGHLIDPLTSILSVLITTVGIMVLFYSDNYMSHDQGYLRFFAYMSFFNTSMLGLVTSSNLIQIYIFWELVGMCSYLLIGFWFTRPIASNACQKAFVTNRVGDFGLLLGILGIYWITGSFEFRDLFKILNNLISNNQVHFLFVTLCAFLVFSGAIAKSAQFPLHVWLPDAMEGPTPISALIHAATMVAAGIFLVARLFPLFVVIPYIMNLIALIGIITVFLGATLALAQKDIKRSLAYSTMSQLGYMMLALGMGSYRVALFHLITHAYSKALLFLGSGSIIHSMEAIVGYSPDKSQNMILMGGLTKHIPITKTAFFLGTLSLCGIPPFACFWSKDEILNDSWLYSPVFAIIACFTAGLTAFYMFRVYLLTFEGHLNVHLKNYSGKKNSSFYSISLWGKEGSKMLNESLGLLPFLTTNNNERASFFWKNTYQIDGNVRKMMWPFITIKNFNTKRIFAYPHESDNTMLFPMLVLVLFALFIGAIGIPFNQIPFNQKGMEVDILSKLLTPSLNLLHQNSKNSVDWYEFVTNAIFSVSIAFFGIFIASSLYKPVYSSLQNLNFLNSLAKKGSKRILWDKIINVIYNWSYNRGYIDAFYEISFIGGIRKLAELIHFFDKRIIDGITNGVGVTSFFVGEGIKYVGSGRISSYLLLYLFYALIFLLIYSFYNL
ncbi:NAD(P)H-quinone oxidoreductase subunit 5, chloroplastic [Ricinus communis]|uniref:NAD(P)H-quinone oxidoreductase subunit 5, chloroplastic n=2 Tax=Ricinus communis TaxID=3988 RepID=G1D7A5_RICCO|nr:NADH dehydrogenase subunit 5 [Ricinus communis]XP_048232427.1 NAD(P)H-quinone oxidoreductase subunit 5, chloroplastic [Ricinus communis]AEJ82603.1 NADH dehydrogenase subunit 5 [Ricinus communis]QWQ50331.1 NADH-plastoquinone oxidoreductase subunit 5 [Ricinus communis]QWQ50416.1 NADH-plastoquinone oxidoreductase subunit 5 [Ricinus communis]QWQ50586.1 NADH-plastoquinone oxidoreductase subunit 5 [Ricinus communis]QWQ50671.1 NADH-plastoquinone oxidoreductase subunit 5 [Ricinus communis]|eukprot:YP_005090225.1 NADH dehydrogenase subunit 5 (chloroplast) [Ricinus communis]